MPIKLWKAVHKKPNCFLRMRMTKDQTPLQSQLNIRRIALM